MYNPTTANIQTVLTQETALTEITMASKHVAHRYLFVCGCECVGAWVCPCEVTRERRGRGNVRWHTFPQQWLRNARFQDGKCDDDTRNRTLWSIDYANCYQTYTTI